MPRIRFQCQNRILIPALYDQEIEAELEERGEGGETGVQAKLTEDVEADRGKLRKEISATLDFDKVNRYFDKVNRCYDLGSYL